MEKLRSKALRVKTVKGNVRLRSTPLPWQTSCLWQVLEALNFSPSAQQYSGRSAPACWDRENRNKIKRIQEVFYRPLCVLFMKLGGRSGADCHCSWGNLLKSYWVCGWSREVVSPSLHSCAVPGAPPKHRGPPCCACACIPFFDGFPPGILTASWSLYHCGPLSSNWWPPLQRKLTGLLSSCTSPSGHGGTAQVVDAQLRSLLY